MGLYMVSLFGYKLAGSTLLKVGIVALAVGGYVAYDYFKNRTVTFDGLIRAIDKGDVSTVKRAKPEIVKEDCALGRKDKVHPLLFTASCKTEKSEKIVAALLDLDKELDPKVLDPNLKVWLGVERNKRPVDALTCAIENYNIGAVKALLADSRT